MNEEEQNKTGFAQEDQTEQSEQLDNEQEPSEPLTELEQANAKIAELRSQLEEKTKECDDFKDRYLRSVADFQNLRKRAMQEKQEAFDYGNAGLLKDLLDSLDNFDRTVEAAAVATDPKAIADGVTMINKGLVSMLENKYNLVAYGAVGDTFDPDIHEAIGKSDDPVAEPVLKEVYMKGYKLKDRVIRHAKVMVSMPDGTVSTEPETPPDGADS
ncbi:MAG: nucleotide exchange factor GrpE [Treponema sp.]|nr:nucleotide exchange factor GrpE [Treponema sp.]